MKQIIGLTGPTGSGKSSAVANAENFGITVIDCDKTVHEIFKSDDDCKAALINAFGENIVKNGEVDRKALAEIAFSTKENTLLLNETVFPFVTYRILKDIENSNGNIILLDAPTLFESGIDEICGSTVAVLSDKDIRLSRILARDGIDEKSALARINAGKEDEFYIENADYVIYNNGEKATFETEFNSLLGKLVIGGN